MRCNQLFGLDIDLHSFREKYFNYQRDEASNGREVRVNKPWKDIVHLYANEVKGDSEKEAGQD